MNRPTSSLLVLVLAAVPAGAADPSPVPVVVTTARAENLGATVSATGTVVSRNDARISSEVGGTLAWIAEPGTVVRRGEAIARLDTARLSLELRDNEAALKRLDAQLALLTTQRTRLESLAGQNLVSQTQLDEAQSREQMAQQDLEQARVARDRAKLDLDRATVRAPFAGIVAERVQQSGEYVASGAPLLRLVNDRELEVVARAPLVSADSVVAGAHARLVDGDRQVTGTVRAVIPVGDERSRMVELRIALTDQAPADRSLRVGAPVRVEIAPQNLKPVVTVPRDAVILRQGASYVMRVRADNTAERVAVNLGPGRDNQVQIDGTLRAGDRVIIRGGERLEPGQTVKVQYL
ncbi:MAG TPA: efflux RND transporter periplasmic adaptor subunit [Steroidobacteraceae bacterium]|nr:efflux RND transporter periplasmic adaptor subunit [Steroidobacteraceae bacterium]